MIHRQFVCEMEILAFTELSINIETRSKFAFRAVDMEWELPWSRSNQGVCKVLNAVSRSKGLE
jgi:hypothetical protein